MEVIVKKQVLEYLLAVGIAALTVGILTAVLAWKVPQEVLYGHVIVGLIGVLAGLILVQRRKASPLAISILTSGAIFALVGMFSFFVSYGVAIALIGVAALIAYWLLKRRA